jgi:hypothetical protein
MVESSKSGEYIFDNLPPWMPSAEGSGNYNLLDVAGVEVDSLNEDVSKLGQETTIQSTETIEGIDKFAKLISVNHKNGEPIEKYRSRTISEFKTLTTEGGINELVNGVAEILNIKSENVSYDRLDENGVVKVSFPQAAIDNSQLTKSELVGIFDDHIAAGYSLRSGVFGTFTYRTESDYNGGTNDSSIGYDGLDANGDPENNGGTYAGLL